MQNNPIMNQAFASHLLRQMAFPASLKSVTPFLRQEDGTPYSVWLLETTTGKYVLKKTSRQELSVYQAFLSGQSYAPKLYGFTQDQADTYLLMEYVPGETLRHCTRQNLTLALDALIASQNAYWQKETLSSVGFCYDEAFRDYQKRLPYMGALSPCYSAFLEVYATVPRTLCSDDLLPFNVIIESNRAVLLDWEYAGLLPYPCALARLLAFGEEEPHWMFHLTAADRAFALDYYYENLISQKGISREAYDRTMQLFFFKEYSEWVYLAVSSGNFASEYYQKYAPKATALAAQLAAQKS